MCTKIRHYFFYKLHNFQENTDCYNSSAVQTVRSVLKMKFFYLLGVLLVIQLIAAAPSGNEGKKINPFLFDDTNN